MNTKAKLYVIAYDIEENSTRIKVANTLKSFGERVQRSVFECWLTPSELEELKRRLKKLINPENDSIRIYTPCGQVQILGFGEPTSAPSFYIA